MLHAARQHRLLLLLHLLKGTNRMPGMPFRPLRRRAQVDMLAWLEARNAYGQAPGALLKPIP